MSERYGPITGAPTDVDGTRVEAMASDGGRVGDLVRRTRSGAK